MDGGPSMVINEAIDVLLHMMTLDFAAIGWCVKL